MEFLESILAFYVKRFLMHSQESLVEVWLLFVFLIKKEVFVAEENSGLHKRDFFRNLFHESFPILVLEGSLSLEITL